METQVRTPHAVFMMPQKLLVPLFQRPYVWNEELQWEPLWRDVQRVASRLLREPNLQHQPHFLGAVVLQQVQNPAGDLQQRTVIDGQQRLTTLQILLDAIHAEISMVGADAAAARIEPLVENGKPFQKKPEDKFKIWPTNKDREAFNEVMGQPFPIDYSKLKSRDHRLVQAHEYFSMTCRSWLIEEGETQAVDRAEALERSVRELVQMVVIDLAPQENAQEIFETLNARGAVLTAADLIKNFIFQRLLEQGTNVEEAYEKYWKNFETAFWEEDVSAGRIKYQRSSLFINQWLISKTGEEVLAREVFSRFKTYADFECGILMPDLLMKLHAASLVYKDFIDAGQNMESEIGALGLFAYRLRVMEMDAVRPVVMYLLDPDESPIQEMRLEKSLKILESWLVRRLLVRATTKSYNKTIPDIIQVIKRNRANADSALEEFFVNQTVETAYWPDDEEIRKELKSLEFYRKIYRARVRMIYEAIEDHLRGWIDGEESKAGTRIKRSKYAIEHIMPRSWKSHWPLPKAVNELERDKEVHTLGNLTLLSSKLNSSVSNSAWKDKKKAVNEHDLLQLNKRVLTVGEKDWTDENIKNRTDELTDIILTIWPAPENHKVLRKVETKRWASKVSVADLIAAGFIQPGQTLFPKRPKYAGRDAKVLPDGRIEIEGQIRDSLSLAGAVVQNRNTNGWSFWLTDTKSRKSMNDVRADYEVAMGIEHPEIEEPEENENDED